MSEKVEFTDEGLFYYKWNGDKQIYIRKRVKKATCLIHLRSTCEISEGVTLKQIFQIVEKYKLIKAFISQYSWCYHINEFHAQAEEPNYILEEDLEPMTHLEISHHVDVNKVIAKKKHPGGTRERKITMDFETSPVFYGIGLSPEGEPVTYSVSCSPMWQLADLPVILNKKVDVYEPWLAGEAVKNNELLHTTTRDFSLLEVLDAIYWDISFMGGPKENAEFIKETKSQLENFKEEMEKDKLEDSE